MHLLDRFRKKTKPEKAKGVEAIEVKYNPAVLRRPWITEKSSALSKLGKYVFVVSRYSSSREIKNSVEAIYGVDVAAVNIINIKPKKRRLGRSVGMLPGYRKAIITLEKGQIIDILPH